VRIFIKIVLDGTTDLLTTAEERHGLDRHMIAKLTPPEHLKIKHVMHISPPKRITLTMRIKWTSHDHPVVYS